MAISRGCGADIPDLPGALEVAFETGQLVPGAQMCASHSSVQLRPPPSREQNARLGEAEAALARPGRDGIRLSRDGDDVGASGAVVLGAGNCPDDRTVTTTFTLHVFKTTPE